MGKSSSQKDLFLPVRGVGRIRDHADGASCDCESSTALFDALAGALRADTWRFAAGSADPRCKPCVKFSAGAESFPTLPSFAPPPVNCLSHDLPAGVRASTARKPHELEAPHAQQGDGASHEDRPIPAASIPQNIPRAGDCHQLIYAVHCFELVPADYLLARLWTDSGDWCELAFCRNGGHTPFGQAEHETARAALQSMPWLPGYECFKRGRSDAAVPLRPGSGAAGEMLTAGLAHPERARLLTPRQKNVLNQLLEGESPKEISRNLGLKESTIRTYIKHMYSRLSVSSRGELFAAFVDLHSVADQLSEADRLGEGG